MIQHLMVALACAAGGRSGIDMLPHSGPDSTLPEAGGVPVSSGGWQQMTVPPGVYVRAISMASPQVGFAAAELGIVLRTTNGGDSWQTVLSQGFPYYYYGCQAIDEQTVVVSGFQNQTGQGIVRWSEDGGGTWGPVIALPGPVSIAWLMHVEFIDANNGITEAAWAGGVHRTTSGGRTAGDWTYVQPSPAWFSGTFTYRPDGLVWLAGIDVVRSPDHGASWVTLPSASPIFDGPIAMGGGDAGFVGGGSISPAVAGWVYATTDGGASWTPAPVLDTAYPIRGLMVFDGQRSWAVGGNVFTNVGGIWGTTDGGVNWTLEQSTGNEMNDLDAVRVDAEFVDVYVAGYVSQIWRKTISAPLAGCPWDLNDDGVVDTIDFLELLARWGTYDTVDFLALLAAWGPCPSS